MKTVYSEIPHFCPKTTFSVIASEENKTVSDLEILDFCNKNGIKTTKEERGYLLNDLDNIDYEGFKVLFLPFGFQEGVEKELEEDEVLKNEKLLGLIIMKIIEIWNFIEHTKQQNHFQM